MGISEKKMQIVINNYFEQECDVNTSIREAFEKGFKIGVKKGISAQPEQRWILCSEKLPKEEDFYSVTLYHEGVDRYYCSSALFLFKSRNYPGMRNFWVPHDDEYDMAVVAWRPLPEPWKGEG